MGDFVLHCSSSAHRDFLGHRKVMGTGRGLRFLSVVFPLWVFVVWLFRFLCFFLSCLCFRLVYLWGVVFVYFGGKEVFFFWFGSFVCFGACF